jgi:hypothetical protein
MKGLPEEWQWVSVARDNRNWPDRVVMHLWSQWNVCVPLIYSNGKCPYPQTEGCRDRVLYAHPTHKGNWRDVLTSLMANVHGDLSVGYIVTDTPEPAIRSPWLKGCKMWAVQYSGYRYSGYLTMYARERTRNTHMTEDTRGTMIRTMRMMGFSCKDEYYLVTLGVRRENDGPS